MDKFEKEFTQFVDTTCFQEEVPVSNKDVDFRENYHEEMVGTQEYTGYAAILGPWMIHMFECEAPLMHKFLIKLNEKRMAKDTYYKNIWVVQYQENISARAYLYWSCKCIKDQTDAVVNT